MGCLPACTVAWHHHSRHNRGQLRDRARDNTGSLKHFSVLKRDVTTDKEELSKGVHPKIAQEILRHSEISLMMDRYSHILTTIQKYTMDGLNDVFSG